MLKCDKALLTKKLFIKTYGCQMNVYDSERMVEALGRSGYVETETPDDADMILLNTCHIREKAAEKIYSELGRFKPLKDEKPDSRDNVMIIMIHQYRSCALCENWKTKQKLKFKFMLRRLVKFLLNSPRPFTYST